jgi:hypothetical protein
MTMKTVLNVSLAVLLGLFSFTAAVAVGQSMVDQGSPGNQGAWPVTGLAASSTFPTTPQRCASTAHKITSVGTSAGTTPSSQLASRRYITLCNSLQNTGSPMVKCRTDGTAPVMAAGNIGDVLGVGDCILYPLAAATSISCIADAAATSVTSWECT